MVTRMPGANGIAVHDGWAYVSNTGQALLLRYPLTSADPAADLDVIARHLVSDDFDIASDGHVYLATHFHNTVVRLDPAGGRTTIAGPDQYILGSTAVAFDPDRPHTLYVTTTGGMTGIRQPGPQPARLIRLTLP